MKESHESTPTVYALLPHSRGSEEVLVNWRGVPPSLAHERGSGTMEETLRRVGKELLGLPNLSVDRREYDAEPEGNGNGDGTHIMYRAKTIGEEAHPAFLHRYDRPSTVPQGLLNSTRKLILYKLRTRK